MAKSQELALHKQQIEKLQMKLQLLIEADFMATTAFTHQTSQGSTPDLFGQLQNNLLLGRSEPSLSLKKKC